MMSERVMPPYRSMLFVPGHKGDWADKGLASGADALIFDLEDAVPLEEKSYARGVVAETVARFSTAGVTQGIWVRPNSWETGLAGADLAAVVNPLVEGLMLPKIYDERDVLRFDALLDYMERDHGMTPGHTKLLLTLETAQSMASCEILAASNHRVVSMLGATARDGDITRALGFVTTPTGNETLYLRSRIILACRAAGLDHPMCGLWQDIHDLEGLGTFARQNRELGYRGQIVLHPSHVPIVHSIFTPTPEEVAYYRGLVSALAKGEQLGDGAVIYRGQHIDSAHGKTARDWIERWERINVLPGRSPERGSAP